MYAGNEPLFVLPEHTDFVELQITSVLRSSGYLVIKSFDLHSAAQTYKDCECATNSCECQMVVLLVYAPQGPPITLMLDGNECETAVYLVNDSSQNANSVTVQNITQQLPDTLLACNPLDSLR